MAGNSDPQPHGKFETADVNARAVSRFVIGLVVLCVTALLLLAWLFQYFKGAPREAGVAAGRPAARGLPPEPRLQSTPAADLKQIRAAEDQILESYAWVDRQRGIVRIPIGRAIDLLAEREGKK